MFPAAENDNHRSIHQGADKRDRLKDLMSRLGQTAVRLPLIDDNTKGDDRTHLFSSLPFGEVHEVLAECIHDYTAAMACLLASVKGSNKPVLWITSRALVLDHGLPYGPGLKQYGFAPDRIILVQAHKALDALWAIEEGLKTDAFAAVVGECVAMDLTASRRLTLAAQTHGSRCLLLMRSRETLSSAAHSRIRVSPATSQDALFDSQAPGDARGTVDLVKHRGGERPFSTVMEWPSNAQDYLYMAAPMADRSTSSHAHDRMRASG